MVKCIKNKVNGLNPYVHCCNKKIRYSKNIAYTYTTIWRVWKVYGNCCIHIHNDLTWWDMMCLSCSFLPFLLPHLQYSISTLFKGKAKQAGSIPSRVIEVQPSSAAWGSSASSISLATQEGGRAWLPARSGWCSGWCWWGCHSWTVWGAWSHCHSWQILVDSGMMRQPSTHFILGSCLFFNCFALNWLCWELKKVSDHPNLEPHSWRHLWNMFHCLIPTYIAVQHIPRTRSWVVFGNKPEEGPFNNLSPQVSHLPATTVPRKWNQLSCMKPFTVTFSFGQQGTTLSLFI